MKLVTRLFVLIAIAAGFAALSAGQNVSTIIDRSAIPAKKDKRILTYERTGCYGTCTSFLVSVFNDSRVEYEGRKFVKVSGKAEFKLSDDQLERLHSAINSAKLGFLRASFVEVGCAAYFTDDYWVYITVPEKKGLKRITHYLGCHPGNGRFGSDLRRLMAFETALEEILEIERLIGTEGERSKFLPLPELIKN